MRSCCILFAVLALAMATRSAAAQDKGPAQKAAAMQAELMKKVMAKFDANGDGTVDDDEKAKVLDQINKDFEAGDIPDGFKEILDRNRNGKVEPQEIGAFRDILKRLQGGGLPFQADAAGRGPGFGGPGFGGAGFGGPGLGGPGGGGAGGNGYAGTFPPDIVKKFDKDKDGQLDDAEKKAALAAMGPKKSRKEQLQEKLDLNGDGKVTKEEKEQVAAQRKAELEEKKAAAEEKKAKSKKKDEKKDDKKDEKKDDN